MFGDSIFDSFATMFLQINSWSPSFPFLIGDDWPTMQLTSIGYINFNLTINQVERAWKVFFQAFFVILLPWHGLLSYKQDQPPPQDSIHISHLDSHELLKAWMKYHIAFLGLALACWIILLFFKSPFSNKINNLWKLGNKYREVIWQVF